MPSQAAACDSFLLGRFEESSLHFQKEILNDIGKTMLLLQKNSNNVRASTNIKKTCRGSKLPNIEDKEDALSYCAKR